MSTTVDNKVVEMRFDNKQFEQGISQSINSLDKLKSTLNFNGTIDNSRLNSISKSVDYLASRFTALGQVFNTVKMQALGLIKSLSIDQIFAGWDKYNQIIASTQTIMSATAKNWTEDKKLLKDQGAQMEFVTEQLDKLNQFTDETSAKLTDMTNNIGKFTSAGVKLDVATDAMMGIATWGYKSGASIDQMSRAMYNLSQAMGMGSLRVQDWMSIENANMATEEFKDTCIKTGLELGVLKKGANGAAYATDRFGKSVKVTTENFRSTLASGWLNSKVITGTLKKYGDFASEILKISSDIDAQVTPMMRDIQAVKDGTLDLTNATKMAERAHAAGTDEVVAYTEAIKKLSTAQYDLGYTAFRASQEAKTFREAIDYTKDAVSTGWMNIFKTIVGDYLEAKELWTAVTEEMYDVFIFDLEQQNNILEKWGEGGGREALLEGISNAWHNIKTLIETIKESFRAIFPPATEKTLLGITEAFKSFTYVMKFTETQTEKLQKLFMRFFVGVEYIADSIKNIWDVMVESIRDNNLLPKDFFDEGGIFDSIHELVVEFTNLMLAFRTTREDAEKLRPIFDAVFGLINAAGKSAKNLLIALSKAFRSVFGDSQTKMLDSVARVINNITKAFEVNEKRAQQFQRIFEAIFSIIDIGKMILEAILEPIFGLTDGTKDLSDILLGVTELIAKLIIDLRNWLKEHDGWKNAIAWIINLIRKIPEYANKASQALFGMNLGEVFERAKEAAFNAWEYLKGVFKTIKDDLQAIFKPISDIADSSKDVGESSSGFERLKKELNGLKAVIEYIKPYFQEFFKMLKDNVDFKFPSMEEMGDAAVKGGFAAVLIMLVGYLKEFFGLFKKAGQIEGSIKQVFDTVSSCLNKLTKAMTQKIKAEMFKTIATGVLEIAAAMFILALLPEDKLMAATFAVGAMMAELAFSFGLISRTRTSKEKLAEITKMLGVVELILATIAGGIYLLASQTDITMLSASAGAIAALFAEVGVFMKEMSKIKLGKDQLPKLVTLFQNLAILMVALGASIAIATATGADWKSIAAAGTVMAGMLFAMAGALKVMPKTKNLKELASGLALVSASMVLLGTGLALAASGGDWASIGAAGLVMSAMIIAIAGALKMLSGSDVTAGASAIAIVSVGLVLLAGAIALMAKLDLAQVGVALLTLAGAIAVILVAGAVAGKIAIGLEALGIAIALIGTGVALAGAGIWMFANGLEKLVGLGSAGTETFINGLNAFFANLPTYAENAGDALITFIDKIAGAKDTLIRGIGTVLESLLQALINVTPKILELIKAIISGVFVMLVELLPDLFTFLDALFEELDAFFWKWAPRIVSTTIMIVRELLRSVKELTPDITATLMAILIDTLTQVKNNIATINSLLIEIAGETIVGILDGLGKEIPRIADAGIDFVVALINGIADGMVEHAQDIHDAMTNLVNALIGSFCALLGINSPSTVFEGFGDNIVQGLINGIAAMIEKAKKIIKDLADGILTKFCELMGLDKPNSKEDWSQFGIKIIQRLNAGFLNMVSKAASVITEVGKGIVDAICKFFGLDNITKSNIYKVGKDIVTGLAKGIKAMASSAVTAITNVGQSVINNLKKVFDSHSPSKVAISIGKFFDVGLANGFDLYSYMAVDSVEAMGHSVIDSLGAVMNSVSDMITEDFDEPTIRPVIDLSNVSDGLGLIDSMLSDDRSMSVAARGISDNISRKNSAQYSQISALQALKDSISGMSDGGSTTTQNNNFYITGNDPKAIAEEVSNILANDIDRRNKAWGM